ncbi:hypothetical protein ACI2OX_03445 [Bacillus sp. N9]
MKETSFIIYLAENDRDTLPNYHDYGLVLNKINQFIKEETGLSMKIYMDNEGQEEMWNVLDEDIKENKAKLLSYVFDTVETGNIHFAQEGEKRGFVIKPAINNSVCFYPEYEVALVKLPIFQSYTDYQREFVFAVNDECLLSFLTYVYERQRK